MTRRRGLFSSLRRRFAKRALAVRMAVITCLNGEGEEEDREKAAAEVLEELQQQVCLSDLGSFPTPQKKWRRGGACVCIFL